MIDKGLFSRYDLSNETVRTYANSILFDEVDGYDISVSFTTLTTTIPIQEATVNEFSIVNSGTGAKFDGINISEGTYKDVLKKYGKPDEETTKEYIEEKLASLPPDSTYTISYSVNAEKDTESVYSYVKIDFQISSDDKIYKIYVG